MCGIVGVASRSPLPDDGLAERARDTMRHRGPDGRGVWWRDDRRVWLAHRRLAIVDLSEGGHQPMVDDAGDACTVFNGEIYNHRALRRELEAAGHRFRSDSDTEVLLAAYRQWGTDCLRRFDGMFAFAIHDRRDDRLFLARDRAGEKPLFFEHRPGRLAFASELKGLLEDPAMPREVDLQALNHYLAYGYVPGDLCMLRGVRKLRAGEAMTYEVGADRLVQWRYWTLPEPPPGPGPQAPEPAERLEEELLDLLRQSVGLRLQADVPVGVLLSGGLDSSLVTALAAEVSPSTVSTFTVSFPGHGAYDEAPHARLVAEHFGTKHTELAAEDASVDLLEDLAVQFDEPMADSSMLPTFLVSQLIRSHATVALAGDGGDELFGGYPHYCWLGRAAKLRRRVPKPLRGAAAFGGTGVLPSGFRGRNHLAALGGDDLDSVANINVYFDRRARSKLVPALASLPVPDRAAPEALKKSLAGARRGSLVEQAMAVDFLTYLVDDLLVKVDRASMLTSLEVRCPWLDHRIVQLAFERVPAELKATDTERKVLTRRLAQRLLPPQLDLRRKQGFSLPLDDWFAGEWGRRMEAILLDGGGATFAPGQVRRLFQLQRIGLPNTQRLFALALFELWRRRYSVGIPA